MCFDDVCKLIAAEHLIGKWQKTQNGGMQLIRAVAEYVDAKLKSFTVITLVIRKLHKCHYFSQSIVVLVAFFRRFTLRYQFQYLPQASCTQTHKTQLIGANLRAFYIITAL